MREIAPSIPPAVNGGNNVDIVTVSRPVLNKHYVTTHPDKTGSARSMFSRLADCMKEKNADIISQFVFGGTDLHGDGMAMLEETCGTVEWPVTWIQGDGASGTLLTGTQVYALSGKTADRIIIDGRIIGNVVQAG